MTCRSMKAISAPSKGHTNGLTVQPLTPLYKILNSALGRLQWSFCHCWNHSLQVFLGFAIHQRSLEMKNADVDLKTNLLLFDICTLSHAIFSLYEFCNNNEQDTGILSCLLLFCSSRTMLFNKRIIIAALLYTQVHTFKLVIRFSN